MEPFTFDFCPRLGAMLDSGHTTSPDGARIPLRGVSTRNNLQVIRNIVLTLRPKRTLEIGLAHGASALTFLASLRDVNETTFSHVAIDPFQLTVWNKAALHAIAEEDLADRFIHHDEESCTVLPRLYRDGNRFEVIYVDGSHLFEDAFLDFFFSTRLLTVGGIILFDDSMDKHVRKVIRFIDANYDTILQRYPIDDLVQKPLLNLAANRFGFGQLTAYSKRAEPPRPWNSPFVPF